MQNIFIAVGGSGTKVAEALVRLLAVGFPTHKSGGLLTSTGDTLQIWRLDPDRSAGAAIQLQNCIDAYKLLQDSLGHHWAMEVEPEIRHLDPLQLPQGNNADNKIETLAGILNSEYETGIESSEQFLDLFYAPKDLNVKVDRGFYQKPFIGSAIMAIFAESLKKETSPGGQQCKLNLLENQEVRFFLCGSVHGGTGACGVPIMGKFLKGHKDAKQLGNKWDIAACLLAPYNLPPDPPFEPLREGEALTETRVQELLRTYGKEKAFANLNSKEQEELVRQILLGFYANPHDIVERAQQSLAFYKDGVARYFSELYLVSKPEPDALDIWSNGGKSQSNPLNSAEVVAALTALNFFAGTKTRGAETYTLGSSTQELNSRKMRLADLPKYTIPPAIEVDAERVLLTSAVLCHLLTHQIDWENPAKKWYDIEGLQQVYVSNEELQKEDKEHFYRAASLISDFMMSIVGADHLSEWKSLVGSGETKGWTTEEAQRVWKLVSNAPSDVAEMKEKVKKKGMMSFRARAPVNLGNSSVTVSTDEFGRWFPQDKEFNRGDYARFIWTELATRVNKED